ncbi:hypothetical protein C8D87_12121 [Lentzea atacamensis]|uniref:Uncharacterized protein n=1 Tax=Lentzea atacamensis TaxID=531938 RepID=A0ABX9DXR9_9PSEU|nr:type II toxin-antitoxin system Phd/YefM family antitoxin [Lentzea atacamensis]RAS57838.1 hypothetical protein C8D87_12121 [Lentzea atacamensis]
MARVVYDPSVPPAYQRVLNRFGEPVGIKEGRKRMSSLVTAAEAGTITLIAPDRRRGGWAAFVPLSEVADPLGRAPVWSMAAARPKLGDLVAAASDWWAPVAQILARYNKPVAALISAVLLEDRPDVGERLDAVELLRNGATITLDFDPGETGSINEHGDVYVEPYPATFSAVVRDHAGAEIASGGGDSITEALLRLRRVSPSAPNADEPPF